PIRAVVTDRMSRLPRSPSGNPGRERAGGGSFVSRTGSETGADSTGKATDVPQASGEPSDGRIWLHSFPHGYWGSQVPSQGTAVPTRAGACKLRAGNGWGVERTHVPKLAAPVGNPSSLGHDTRGLQTWVCSGAHPLHPSSERWSQSYR